MLVPTYDPSIPSYPDGWPRSMVRDMPRWADATVTWDADGVRSLVVYALRPGRSVTDLHTHIADSMTHHGLLMLDHGQIGHMGQAGAQYAYTAEWSTWRTA